MPLRLFSLSFRRSFDATCLHLAAQFGHLPVLKHLHDKIKVDLTTADEMGNVAFHYAAAAGQVRGRELAS